MCLVFTCGEHDFVSPLEGYEHVTAQCQNCGNYAARVVRRWPWFTFCFVPVIPLATHAYGEVTCPVCRFEQDISLRPDVQAQKANAPNELTQQGYSGGPPPPGAGPAPAPGQAPAQGGYAPNQGMQYK